jgi:hypothetical protein
VQEREAQKVEEECVVREGEERQKRSVPLPRPTRLHKFPGLGMPLEVALQFLSYHHVQVATRIIIRQA